MFPLQSTSQSQHTRDHFYTEVGLKFPRSHKRRVANASFSQADADQFSYFLSEYFHQFIIELFPFSPCLIQEKMWLDTPMHGYHTSTEQLFDRLEHWLFLKPIHVYRLGGF